MPQAPQLFRSVCVLTSQPSLAMPLQSAKPGLQIPPQTPLVHVTVPLGKAGQTLPQLPQLLGSVCTLVHPLGQQICPLEQALEPLQEHEPFIQVSPELQGGEQVIATQVPPEQVCPEAQTCPQLPQLLESVCRLTHPIGDAQQVWPLEQAPEPLQEHEPFIQTSPTRQVFPQVPQLKKSLCVSAQVPLEQHPEQHSLPAIQAAPLGEQEVTHIPPWQVCPEAQTIPQPPQLFGSVASLTHMPLQQF